MTHLKNCYNASGYPQIVYGSSVYANYAEPYKYIRITLTYGADKYIPVGTSFKFYAKE